MAYRCSCGAAPMRASEDYGEALAHCDGCSAIFISNELLRSVLNSDAATAYPLASLLFAPYLENQSVEQTTTFRVALERNLVPCPACNRLMQRIVEDWGAVSVCHAHGVLFQDGDMQFFVSAVHPMPSRGGELEQEAFDLLVAADQPDESDVTPSEFTDDDSLYDFLIGELCRRLLTVISF